MFLPYYVKEQKKSFVFFNYESCNSRSTNSIYHQNIYSLFSVEKTEQYLLFLLPFILIYLKNIFY